MTPLQTIILTTTPTDTSTPTSQPPTPTQILIVEQTEVPAPTIPTSIFLDDFEYSDKNSLSTIYWINAPGNELVLDLVGQPYISSGQKALSMNYRILGNPPSDYVGIERDLAPSDWRGYSNLCIWINNSNFTGHLVIQFREQNGEVWKSETQLRNINSQTLCIPLNETNFSLTKFGASHNSLIDLSAINNFSLYIGGGGKTEGTIYLDSLRLQP